MTATESVPTFTFEEHLRLEKISERRHEWVAGTVYALSGGTERHALLSLILYRLLADTARRERCRAFHADRMIRTAEAAYYPDVMVVCGPAGNRQYETDASWLVEVMSPSTHDTDRREKVAAYLTVSSLRGYLLIHPDHRSIELGTPDPDRDSGHGWSSTSYLPGSTLVMGGTSIDVDDLWRQLDDEASLT